MRWIRTFNIGGPSIAGGGLGGGGDVVEMLSRLLDWLRRHMFEEILPNWRAHALQENGLLYPQLDRKWRRRPGGFCTLVSQSRAVFNFARGAQFSDEPSYVVALERAVGALLEFFRDRRAGGWRWSCGPDGEPLEEVKSAYGHAFVVLSLSIAGQQLGRSEHLRLAEATLGLIKEKFTDPHGGIVWWLDGHFSDLGKPRSQNPMMHLFEACLALYDATGSELALDSARELFRFVFGRLCRADGVLPEWYDQDWRELEGDRGGVVDVGHSFEWSYLLSEAARLGVVGEDGMRIARQMLELGLRVGFDRHGGGVWSPASPDLASVAKRKGWWEQCEALRALIRFVRQGSDELLPYLEKTVDFVRAWYIDPEFQGWFLGPVKGAKLGSRDKGNEGKVDYHVVGLCTEAFTAVEPLNRVAS